MAIIDIPSGTDTINVTTGDNLVLLREGRYLTVEGFGLVLEEGFDNYVLIDGTVFAEDTGILESSAAASSTIVIGQEAEVLGESSAVRLSGNLSELTNNGLLTSSFETVRLDGENGSAFNTGTISSDEFAVSLAGTGHTLINQQSILATSIAVRIFGEDSHVGNSGDISSGAIGLRSDVGVDSVFTLQNSGTISGPSFAILGFGGIEEITNTGSLIGDVSLGSGDDLLESRNGEITGRILLEGGDDRAILGSEDNFVDGRAGADMIRGGGGDDEIQGGSGDDELRGGAGDDDIIGEDSNDEIYGGRGEDILRGNSGADRLFGGTGNDVLAGGSGDDRMNGGRDDDVLTGNGGADVFIFNRQAGHDEITDFNDGVDMIDLQAFNVSAGDVLAATSVVGGNSLIDLDALGGNGSILIEGDTSMTAGDFLL